MNLLDYIPKRRHFRHGRGDGYRCVQCGHMATSMLELTAHKAKARHPFVGDGRIQSCRRLPDGSWAPLPPTFLWRPSEGDESA